MRTYCCQHYSQENIGKFIFAAVAILSSSNLVAISPSTPLTHDGELLLLHRELRLVESESHRVAITVDALQEELQENSSRDYIEQLHSQLGHLYKYDVQRASLYIDLSEVWSYLQNPDRKSAPTKFRGDQSKPIPKIHIRVYEGLPEDAIPISDIPPSNIEYIYTHLIHSQSIGKVTLPDRRLP